MGPEKLCFRPVRPSVRACVRAKAFFDQLAVDFSCFVTMLFRSSLLINLLVAGRL